MGDAVLLCVGGPLAILPARRLAGLRDGTPEFGVKLSRIHPALGLAICKGLADADGGRIRAGSGGTGQSAP